jgi:hypothetical protein
MPGNNGECVTATHRAVDRAVEAGKRLRQAAGKVGDAYADACQETMLGFTDLRRGAAGSTPTADGLTRAGKQIGRAYIEALELAALASIDLRESFAAATNTGWIQSMARRQARLERDAANALFSLARGLLV